MSGREESVAERCRVTVVVGLMLVVENGSVGGYSWHIGAAWRPLTFPCLSLSLSLSFSRSFSSSLFRLLCIVLSAARHLSPSHLAVPPFSLARDLSFCTTVPPFISSFPRVSPRLRVNSHTNTQGSFTRTGVDPSLSTPSTLCLLVSTPPAFVPSDPSTLVSPSDHSPRCFVLLFVSSDCDFPPFPIATLQSLLRPAFISQQNLRDGTPAPTTINEKPCTKCITTSHVPATKGHALTSRFFPYLLLLFLPLSSFLLSSRNQPANLLLHRSARLPFQPYRISPRLSSCFARLSLLHR